MVSNGRAPYHNVLTNGWVLDAEGRAMSKSLGTGMHPNEIIKTHGAEILRLWAASVDFREDVVISPDILTRLSEAYRKLRNTFRWALGNLGDFDPERDAVADADLGGQQRVLGVGLEVTAAKRAAVQVDGRREQDMHALAPCLLAEQAARGPGQLRIPGRGAHRRAGQRAGPVDRARNCDRTRRANHARGRQPERACRARLPYHLDFSGRALS